MMMFFVCRYIIIMQFDGESYTFVFLDHITQHIHFNNFTKRHFIVYITFSIMLEGDVEVFNSF